MSVRGLVVSGESSFCAQSEQLIALAALCIAHDQSKSSFFEAGGLIANGASQADLYRQAGVYAGRVLKGEKPADLRR